MLKVIIIVFAAVLAFCLFCLVGAVAVKAGTPIVEIKNVEIDDLVVQGFELTEKSEVDIYSVGAATQKSKNLFAYGWIIDAESREVVWSMQDDCYETDRLSTALVECEETLRLRPGKYEVYFYAGAPNIFINSKDIRGLGELISLMGDIFSGEDITQSGFYDEDAEELTMVIKAGDKAGTYLPEFSEMPGNVVSINQPERDEYHRQGFTLKETIDLSIYAIGEFSESFDVFVDGGWIINAETHKKVWSMDKWNTERAGGESKNRYFRDIISLPAGNYIAYYTTDDSHNPGEWNSPPPADPMNYGLTVAVADPDDIKYVSAFEQNLVETEIVSLSRVRDNSSERSGFTLNEDARIHIIGLGERDFSNDFLVDYGWIVDADDLDRVWEMTAENTVHAGGGAKNCRFDGIIDLPAGNYVVYYRTDDSHAYGDWNAAPPFDKTLWGISLFGIGNDFDENSFALADKFKPSGNILVDLTGLRNDEDVSQTFSLTETTRVRVLALGEGKGNNMYDYGWIENDKTDEIVWEMTYRKTDNAGGASKNRAVSANLTLDEGTYTAYFITDDSHSYLKFNASPPDNPERWGMLVTKK